MINQEHIIGNITDQIRGVTFKKDIVILNPASGYLPILRANNIRDDFKIDTKDLVYVPEENVKEHQILRKGDIVVVTSSGSKKIVGKAAGFDLSLKCSFGAFCKVIRPVSEEIRVKFLWYFFQSYKYRKKISELATGANILNIRNSHLDKLTVLSPKNLTEQDNIIATLDKAQTIIDKRQKSIRQLDKLLKDSFLEMFQNTFNEVEQLISIGEIIEEGPQNGLYKHEDHYGSGVPILRIDSFYDGILVGMGNFRRLKVSEKELLKYSLKEDDIVINRVNSRPYLGKSAIVPELKEPTVFESNMMRFSINRKIYRPKFIIYALQQDFVKQQILKRAKDAINQSSINQKDVKWLKIPRCSIEEQLTFEALFDKVSVIKLKQETCVSIAENLFQSLLQRAFHGDLLVDIDLQLDTILETEAHKTIAKDEVMIQKLIDRFNLHNQTIIEIDTEEDDDFIFETFENYEKAKKTLFYLLKIGKAEQTFDKALNQTTLKVV